MNKLQLPARDKPLPKEKALPPRPLARLSTDPSPRKDSRCLIDACEQPLHIASISGEKREWPSLRPQPSRSASGTPPSLSSAAASDSAFLSLLQPATASPMMAAANQTTDTISSVTINPHRASKRSSHSLASSYISAKESSSQITASYQSYGDPSDTDETHAPTQSRRTLSNASSHVDLPKRTASLRNRISNGSLVTRTAGSRHQVTTMTDFTRPGAASPSSIGSRTHSPSPASFSRPRPGSMASTGATPRSMKTASRIPIPDSKKATIVDVKKDLPPTPTVPKNTGIPTFGSRRLASPDALKILENGKMRRQLQRATPAENTNTSPQIRLVHSSINGDDQKLASSSYSATSSSSAEISKVSAENTTFDSSSNNDDEPPTPSDKTFHFPGGMQRKPRPSLQIATTEPDYEQRLFPSGNIRAATRPPQTSPFVAPLETIPSEAILTLDANDFNDETKEELIRTLSHLEGKGSPPKYDVDNETLLHMFGHLKKGLERKPHSSSALIQNAAAAEKFLAMRGSSILEVKGLGNDICSSSKDDRTESADETFGGTIADRKQTVISKWSASTPSDKALSPPSDEICTGLRPPSAPKARPKSSSLPNPVSIGYPSRIPSRIAAIGPSPIDDAATIASIPSRRSSPTLSKRKPGSVRAAREGLQIANSSFMRTTASAESRKIAKSPNGVTRAFSVADTAQRGRTTAMEKARSRSDGQAVSKVSQ